MKSTTLLIVVGGLAVAGYFLYRSAQAQAQQPTLLGTVNNLINRLMSSSSSTSPAPTTGDSATASKLAQLGADLF